MNNGVIRVPKGKKLSCALCKRTEMTVCWPLKGSSIATGSVSIIGVLCPTCRGLAATGVSSGGFSKGWDSLAITLRDRGFTLTGMMGMYQRQSKKGVVWRRVKNSYRQEGARGRGEFKGVK